MFRKIALSLAVTLWSFSPLLVPTEVSAQTPLTRAVIESLRNQVRLIPQNQSARPARPSDAMNPGDALATAKAATAQLRFNDGSLARLGEQAVFKFVPGNRSFTLSNGTALVLIPPGQGSSSVRTPNAAAGIRGSALFVRYIPETETTIVGALTNSGIQVFNRTASQSQELKAGNMAVIVKDRIERIYEFDLNTFYQTSELARGLNLTKTEPTPSPDEAIAKVQAETAEALKAQSQLTGKEVIENPSFVQLPANTSGDFPRVDTSAINDNPSSGEQNSAGLNNTLDIRSVLEGGEIRATQSRPTFPPGVGGNGSGGNPQGNPPGTGNPPGVGGNGSGGNPQGNGNGNPAGTGNPPGVGGNGSSGANTGVNLSGDANAGVNLPAAGNTGVNLSGDANAGVNLPAAGNTGVNASGGVNAGVNLPAAGNARVNASGSGNTRVNLPGQAKP